MTTHNKLAVAALSGLFAAGMMVSGSAFADHHTADATKSTSTATEKHACKTDAKTEKSSCKTEATTEKHACKTEAAKPAAK